MTTNELGAGDDPPEETVEEMQARWRHQDKESWAPAPEQPQPPPPGVRPKQPHQPAGKKHTGKRAADSRNKVRAQLKALYFNGGAKLRARFKKFDDFVAYLQHALGGRHPFDLASDVSAVLKLRYATLTEVEEKWDVWWRKTYPDESEGKRHRRFTMIRPIDKTPEELQKARKKDRNAELAKTRKQERANRKENEMQVHSCQQTNNLTRAGLMAAQKANTQAQIEVLDKAIGDDLEWSAQALAAKVRGDAPWREIGNDEPKLYRTVLHRLDALKAAGRIDERYDKGPRGSFVRIVFRLKRSDQPEGSNTGTK